MRARCDSAAKDQRFVLDSDVADRIERLGLQHLAVEHCRDESLRDEQHPFGHRWEASVKKYSWRNYADTNPSWGYADSAYLLDSKMIGNGTQYTITTELSPEGDYNITTKGGAINNGYA